jgi:hypothetical protein
MQESIQRNLILYHWLVTCHWGDGNVLSWSAWLEAIFAVPTPHTLFRRSNALQINIAQGFALNFIITVSAQPILRLRALAYNQLTSWEASSESKKLTFVLQPECCRRAVPFGVCARPITHSHSCFLPRHIFAARSATASPCSALAFRRITCIQVDSGERFNRKTRGKLSTYR